MLRSYLNAALLMEAGSEAEAEVRFAQMLDTTAFALTQKLKNFTHDMARPSA